MQKLPARMWFTSSTELTQRLETNVFFTESNPKADYVFRANPNATLGYNISPRSSVYSSWFLIKDVFADHGVLSYPTTQSLSGGLRHEIPIKSRTNVQFDYQIRELWQAAGLRQADMIPGVTVTHVFSPRLIAFGNIQLQMRSRNIFQGPTREIDPFYTVGLLYRWKQWNLVATNTLVNNFRFRDAIPQQSNNSMIADIEVSRPISKRLPGVVAFMRAEPIWNWGSHGTPGLSGFDFRLFSGVRISIDKPSYYTSVNKLKEQLKQSSNTQSPGASIPGNNQITQASGEQEKEGASNQTDAVKEGSEAGETSPSVSRSIALPDGVVQPDAAARQALISGLERASMRGAFLEKH